MKYLVVIIALICSIGNTSFAQNKKDIVTETIQVPGTCGMCKERIEKAAYISGVKRADWNKAEGLLTVTYKSSKVSIETIEKSIAKAGHDAGKEKALKDAYNNLPECCAYDDHGSHKH